MLVKCTRDQGTEHSFWGPSHAAAHTFIPTHIRTAGTYNWQDEEGTLHLVNNQ